MKLTNIQFQVLYGYPADVLRVECRWGNPLHVESRDLQARLFSGTDGGSLRVDLNKARQIISAIDATTKEKTAAIFMEALCSYGIKRVACEIAGQEMASADHAALIREVLSAGKEFAALLSEPERTALLNKLGEITAEQSKDSDTSAAKVVETKEQRQDRRLQACVDAGLPMDSKAALSRLPDGIGKVADKEGVSRQAFSTDVKAALKRQVAANREGATVRR